jgi:hypothetical protein
MADNYPRMTVENCVSMQDLRPGVLMFCTSRKEVDDCRAAASTKIRRKGLNLRTSVVRGKSVSGIDGWLVVIYGDEWPFDREEDAPIQIERGGKS